MAAAEGPFDKPFEVAWAVQFHMRLTIPSVLLRVGQVSPYGEPTGKLMAMR